jgi:hypothetical protein
LGKLNPLSKDGRGRLSIVILFIFGLNGNDWREKKLLSRGFDFKMTVESLNQDQTVSIYLKEK